MELIDTHTHPFDEAFDVDRAEAVARACEAGVRRMMCPAIDAATHAALFGLCIHTREAWPEMLGLLREFRGSGVRGVMHAFSGTWEEYEAVKACGDFLFGIGGVVTYKKSTLPEVVSRMPLGDMVLETDAPYLPPVPYRGKRNEPAYIVHVCRKVAELKGIAPEEVAAATSVNACRMFGI